MVIKSNNSFETSLHRNSTFSGAYTNFISFIATECKNSLVSTLLYISFIIVSDYPKLHEQIVKLKTILREN